VRPNLGLTQSRGLAPASRVKPLISNVSRLDRAMTETIDLIDNAIERLWAKRTFWSGGRQIEIALLVRTADWRPLKAEWWRGKEVCVIGVDLNGNFLLRHCDGTVRYWDHQSSTERTVASSVKAFVAGISE
jgi:hypothetical protein